MPVVLIGEASRQWAHNLDDLRARWKIRREAPTETDWMPAIAFSQVCQVLDLSSLFELRAGLTEIQHGIVKQMRLIKAGWRKHNIANDYDTYVEVQAARDAVERHLLIVNDQIGVRKQIAKDRSSEMLERRFVQVAKIRLPPDTFQQLMNEAKNGK